MQNSAFINALPQDFDKLLPYLPGAGQIALRQLRKAALQKALDIGVPTPRTLTWKYALLQNFLTQEFSSFLHPGITINRKVIEPHFLHDLNATALVFINGFYSPALSHKSHLDPEITCTHTGHIAKIQPDLLDEIMKDSANSKHFFPLLNAALCTDSAFILIPENYHTSCPIYIYHLLTNQHATPQIHPQAHIIVSKNAKATVIENIIVLTEDFSFINSQTNIKSEKNSTLDYYRMAQNPLKSNIFQYLNSTQFQNSNLHIIDIALGSGYHRLENNYNLLESGSQFSSSGIMIPDSNQHIDWVNQLTHFAPHCKSHQTIKSIVGVDGHSSFWGKITVNNEATKTQANMINHNILLSEGARAQTCPQLEILTDDVQCTHGATVGQLNRDEIFYLQTRGLSSLQANKILLDAFIKEIFNGITAENLKQDIERLTNYQLDKIITRSLK